MKTIEELANLGAKAALESLTDGSESMSVGNEILPDCWRCDQPAREAFARAVRDAVLANQPSADVPTWRPIAEFPARPHDDDGNLNEYVYWDGEMSWHGNFTEKHDATHFIAHPPKSDPFEAWWKDHKGELDTIQVEAEARMIWNAALEAKA